jgi:hypothetical protein
VSHDQLREVEASRAFEATRRFDELAFYHVPFDQLNGDDRTEATLARLMAAGGRVAVIGPSGSGKSSIIASVLGPFSEALPANVVPLRVPVAASADATVTEPGELARHVVRYVTRWASRDRFSVEEQERFEHGLAESTRRSAGGRSREYHVGLPLWLANVEFSRQVQSTGEEYELHGTAIDAIEHLKRLVELFGAHDLRPALAFDDSDTWLRIPGLDRRKVANAFFTRGLGMLSREVDIGFVIAVHDEYLALPGYRRGRELLSGEVPVPRLIDPVDGIGTILRDRLVISEVPFGLDEVLEPEAILGLAKHYESGRSLRDVLRVAQRALQHAVSDGVDRLTVPLVDQATTELSS